MAPRGLVALFLLVLATCPGCVLAQASPVAFPDFDAVDGLQQDGSGPAVIDGRPARTEDYPASFFSTSGEDRCTSTLVADRALLTAAHCVADGGRTAIRRKGVRIGATCTHAPDYAKDKTADWALCLMDAPVAAAWYETINDDRSLVAAHRRIRLTGFGCIRRDMEAQPKPQYWEGETEIIDPPNARSHDIVTRGGAVLCAGDSGGPAFVGFSADFRKRALVAVNSRTAVDKYTDRVLDTSFLSSVSEASALNFFNQWSRDNGVELCGLSAGAAQCRAAR